MKFKHLTIILILIFANIYKKTWRQIPAHKNTILFVVFWNSFYYYICKRYLVWEFKTRIIPWRVMRFLHIWIATPLVTLLYLANLPDQFKKKVYYLLKWSIGSFFLEIYMYKQGLLRFKHGWNVLWSGLLYFKWYLYSDLYRKNPLLTWGLSVISLVFFVVKFKVPFSKRMLKGPLFIFLPKKKRMSMQWEILLSAFYNETIKNSWDGYRFLR